MIISYNIIQGREGEEDEEEGEEEGEDEKEKEEGRGINCDIA